MLWQTILGFDLDYPLSEYGFSTRLETENSWTTNFAHHAIIEYKKFMFLAAVSDSMVSPPEIVDIVWHQHLIFTQSYNHFCALLGKKIEHIPSTHNRSDERKFRLAKEHTQKIYREHFGEQPAVYWEYENIYSPLLLEKSRFSIDKIIAGGMLLFFPLLFIVAQLLKPLYTNIRNPFFVMGYILFVIFIIIVLNKYNRLKFSRLTARWDKQSFIFNLSPLELVYLKGSKIIGIVNGVINHLVKENKVSILPGMVLAVHDITGIKNATELSVIETIKENARIRYPALLRKMVLKPVFCKTVLSIDGFKKYFRESGFFIRLFFINFSILGFALMLGTARIVTGVMRHKPVTIIAFIVLIFVIAIIIFLSLLKLQIGSYVIIQYHQQNRPSGEEWEWQYFLLGSAVFVPAFMPLIEAENAGSGGDSGGSSGCSSGCGSSCGGGCGGCGGGD